MVRRHETFGQPHTYEGPRVAEMNEDTETLRRCREGDEAAYREIVQRYQRQVYSVAMRMVRSAEDAEDLTQDTFVRMFKAIDRYDPTRPFAAWLMTIASRLCIDHIRRRKVRPIAMPLVRQDAGTHEEQTIDVVDPGLQPDEITSHREEEQQAQLLIDSLPPHYRIVVVLRHQQDLSYEEIATSLDLPIGTVKARIHRARALLRQRIEGEAS
jgi:RNA polymerase sigma-70 factor (ECF subfamily)